MANHRRGKPKNARAGCLMCKDWKVNGASLDSHSAQERRINEKAEQERSEAKRENA